MKRYLMTTLCRATFQGLASAVLEAFGHLLDFSRSHALRKSLK